MFFVLLRTDRYTGILGTDGGFELSPINSAPQLQRFPRLFFQDAGMRGDVLPRTRASSSRPEIIAAPPVMITAVVLAASSQRAASEG